MLSEEQKFISRLQRTQWLSADELARYQQPLIERLVRHAATQTDFYPERLAPLFGGGDPATAPIDLSNWDSIPIIARADAIHHVERMRARTVPPDTGALRQSESSGSTGRRLKHFRSEIADVVSGCMYDRAYELHELDLDGSLAVLIFDPKEKHAYPNGGKSKGWNRTNPGADVFLLDIGASPAEKLEWLERVRPRHVTTYPISLREVAECACEKGSNLRFSTFVSTGEVLDQQSHDLIAAAFGCRVIDLYGVREVGLVAFQCPDAERHHLCAEALHIELLDEQGQPVRPGRFGRVIVTSLYNYAMPFIRYEVGDYALASGEACACGRGLPSIDQIGGRSRNMLVLPDGSKKRVRGNVFVNADRYLAYREIQIAQIALDRIEVRYVPDGADAAPDIDGLTRFLRGELHAGVTITLAPVQRIERGAGMKMEQFVSEVRD
jgi:phenylacetate-CoA ligase